MFYVIFLVVFGGRNIGLKLFMVILGIFMIFLNYNFFILS